MKSKLSISILISFYVYLICLIKIAFFPQWSNNPIWFNYNLDYLLIVTVIICFVWMIISGTIIFFRMPKSYKKFLFLVTIFSFGASNVLAWLFFNIAPNIPPSLPQVCISEPNSVACGYYTVDGNSDLTNWCDEVVWSLAAGANLDNVGIQVEAAGFTVPYGIEYSDYNGGQHTVTSVEQAVGLCLDPDNNGHYAGVELQLKHKQESIDRQFKNNMSIIIFGAMIISFMAFLLSIIAWIVYGGIKFFKRKY